MRIPEKPVCINLFRQNPVFTSLHLRTPVHVVPPLGRRFLAFLSLDFVVSDMIFYCCELSTPSTVKERALCSEMILKIAI
jgi:hypothetical protein